MRITFDENQVVLIGKVDVNKLVTKDFGERFCRGFINVERTSGTVDHVPISFEKNFLSEIPNEIFDEKVILRGKIVTYNDHYGHLNIFVQIYKVEPCDGFVADKNEVKIEGNICKISHRTTPLGRRISDIMLACNWETRRTAYIPTIVWGRGADKLKYEPDKKRLTIVGRLQSRLYKKVYPDECEVVRETYELSVDRFDFIE